MYYPAHLHTCWANKRVHVISFRVAISGV